MPKQELDIENLIAMCEEKLNSQKESIHKYLVSLDVEFTIVRDFINELIGYTPFKLDRGEAELRQSALDIAVVITYGRNFKNSYGYFCIKEIQSVLKQCFNEDELKLHNKLIQLRDKGTAHSDAETRDVQIYNEGMFSHSIKEIELLNKEELEKLSEMVSKIRGQIMILTGQLGE